MRIQPKVRGSETGPWPSNAMGKRRAADDGGGSFTCEDSDSAFRISSVCSLCFLFMAIETRGRVWDMANSEPVLSDPKLLLHSACHLREAALSLDELRIMYVPSTLCTSPTSRFFKSWGCSGLKPSPQLRIETRTSQPLSRTCITHYMAL